MATMRRSGFTLIEILISLGLSTQILYLLFAGFRVANQCVTQCNRLSLENQVLRAGFLAALDEVDTWNTLDDPDDLANQKLRATGLPFSPMTFTNGQLAFDQSNPTSWWLGCANRKGNDKRGGDYSLLARLGDTPDAAHSSYPTRLTQILHGLGYYAAADYLPGNEVYTWYDNDGTFDWECGGGGDDVGLNGRCTHDSLAHDLMSLTYSVDAFEITNILPPPNIDGFTVPDLAYISQHYFNVNGTDYGNGHPRIVSYAKQPIQLLAAEPPHWPVPSVTVQRYCSGGAMRNIEVVQVQNPVSGQVIRLSFACVGTTLRGARRNRNLDLSP